MRWSHLPESNRRPIHFGCIRLPATDVDGRYPRSSSGSGAAGALIDVVRSSSLWGCCTYQTYVPQESSEGSRSPCSAPDNTEASARPGLHDRGGAVQDHLAVVGELDHRPCDGRGLADPQPGQRLQDRQVDRVGLHGDPVGERVAPALRPSDAVGRVEREQVVDDLVPLLAGQSYAAAGALSRLTAGEVDALAGDGGRR